MMPAEQTTAPEQSIATTPKISAIEMCGYIGRCYSSPESYRDAASTGLSFRKATKKNIAEYALRSLDAAHAQDVALHAKNVPLLEANRSIRSRLTNLLNEVGITDKTRIIDRTARKRAPQPKHILARWLEELGQLAPIDDGFDSSVRRYNALKVEYEKYLADGEQEAVRAATESQRAQERAVEERKANIQLAQIITRYGLEMMVTWPDVVEQLRKRDQRIDLAIAMQETRGDWSEGFYRVTAAIKRFTITTEEDKNIAASVVESCGADHGDGRVFRDCDWNYDRIWQSVGDRQLVEDVQLAMSRCPS